MNELKFDRARFEAGEMPTRTLDGRKVLHVHDSGLGCIYPIAAWIENQAGVTSACTYTRGGRSFSGPTCSAPISHGADLVHEPKIIHKIGNRYLRMNNNEYILGYIGNGKVVLMNTKSGRRFAKPTAVDNALKLSEAEWDTLTLGCGDAFKLITP